MGDRFAIAIIGAGPGGLSAAARASELGISHLLLEAAADIADTVRHFQKGKRVMAEPARLPLRAAVGFAAGPREQVLETWRQDVVRHGVNLRTGAAVIAIAGQRGDFRLDLAGGGQVTAGHVVLAIGLQGNIRTLGVPGEDLPGVEYRLDDPDRFRGETILVIGGGDAGVEDALALSAANRVILLNRQEEFTQCREANYKRLNEALAAGRLEVRQSTTATRVERDEDANPPLSLAVRSPQGTEHLRCHRIIARLGATPPRQMLEGFGIRFPSGEPSALPILSEQYESNVPGLYIVGSLAGYPLIKQALNQGYEVVHSILGDPVEPADQPLLRTRFSGIPGFSPADDGIALLGDSLPLLASLNSLQLREFVIESDIRAPAPGELIFRKSDYGNSFFSVLRGAVQIRIEKPGEKDAVVSVKAGDFFGEIGLLSGRRRTGTAIAGERCVVVETPRWAMLRLLDASPGVQRRLDEVALKRVVRTCFGDALPEDQVELLVQEARTKHYAVGETLFHEGDAADGLYMIRRGSVTVSRLSGGKEVVVAYMSAGSYIGEMALVSNMPRTATVRAAAPTEAVLLEAGRFTEVLERNPAVRGEVLHRSLAAVRSKTLSSGSKESELIRFLMGQGVGEATDVLLIDYARCIRCDNCESACAAVHEGTPRLDRAAGRTFQQIHVPSSCRHCEHPRCMKDCPPNAIHRSPGGEIYISDDCIGCGNCRSHCPYGVIVMAEIGEHRPPGLLQLVFGAGRRAPVRGIADREDAKKAVKCDMCRDIIGGAACVRACPTGAAFRVSPEEFLVRVGQ